MINRLPTAPLRPFNREFKERSGSIRDPFGHRWLVGHRIEEVSPDEMQRRYATMLQSGPQ